MPNGVVVVFGGKKDEEEREPGIGETTREEEVAPASTSGRSEQPVEEGRTVQQPQTASSTRQARALRRRKLLERVTSRLGSR